MLVSKRKYKELEARFEKIEQELKLAKDELSIIHAEKTEAEEALSAVQEDMSVVESELSTARETIKTMTSSEKNEIRLVISDNLKSVEPFVRFKESAGDHLLQDGYISRGDEFSIQVGLMLVAHEALQQIIDSHTSSINTED